MGMNLLRVLVVPLLLANQLACPGHSWFDAPSMAFSIHGNNSSYSTKGTSLRHASGVCREENRCTSPYWERLPKDINHSHSDRWCSKG